MEIALGVAQVFVAPLVGTIFDRYVPQILEKIGMKWDVTEEMEKLSDILLTIQGVLEDAEDKQTTSKPIRNWLRKLKDIAYDVEDILDECATEVALHEPESTGIINGAAMVDRFKRFFVSKKRFKRRSMIKRIKRLINNFEEIAKQRSELNLINLSLTTRVVNYRVDPGRETSSFPTELKVFGRDEEKECIVNLMVNNVNAENLSIYAIVGMGGLGKTTLAQMVYNDNMVTSRFEIKRWVCVSENFEVKSLIVDIIQSESNNSSQTLDQLQRCLQEELSGKRFLLILDDVWNEDEAKWERLKSSLSCGAKGSSIIVTTRSDKVASLMSSSHEHVRHPKMLSEEDCFSLFKHRAFAEGEGEHHPNLESIGKEIVKKCGGVPLAAKALGGLLRLAREEQYWLFVKDSKLWDLSQDKENSILPALWLSYKHLPQHQRQCFTYCSIFPKDYRMEKEVLIQLWMANGFLQPKGNMELEDIGNGVFNDLVWRGFFQEVSIDDFDNTVCKIHDLVHDLACSITRDECFSVVTDADEELVVGRRNTTRHLAKKNHKIFSPNFSLSMFQPFLRTLLQLDVYTYNIGVPPPPLNFSNLTCLRVLDLRGLKGLKTLPESIGKLKLLRYLDLSETHIAILSDEVFCNLINLQTLKLCGCFNLEMLPKSIGKLKLLRYLDLSETRIAILSDKVFGNLINLQTLKLLGCGNLEMLPRNLRKLTNLRHLDITSSTEKLPGMPVGMGQLKCLHKLSHFIVSEDCGVGELQELDHLRGKLEITCLWKVNEVRDAENAKLSTRKNIRVLGLNWLKREVPAEESQPNSMNDKLIADALEPHPNIEELRFYNYGGFDFPRWMNSDTCLSSLVRLELSNCSKCKHLPTLGLLPHLKELFLRGIPVECIGNEFYCDEEEGNTMILFPDLEELHFSNMGSLEEWKGWSSSSRLKEEGEAQVSVLPVLRELSIIKCPMLVSLPEGILQNLTSLKDLTIERCYGLKSLSLQHLTNLHELRIRNCPALELLPNDFQNLVFFEDLYLEGTNLPEGLLQNLTSLEYLTIQRCDGLKSLSLQHLTNLHQLMIRNCPELELLPNDFQNLVSLECMYLDTLPNLPERILQNLTSLEYLTIQRCDGLKSLSLQHLTNLEELRIRNCPALELLPDDFQNLVSLQSLSLPSLDIFSCHPELHRRWQKNTGEDSTDSSDCESDSSEDDL